MRLGFILSSTDAALKGITGGELAAEDWSRQHGASEMGSDCVIENEISYRAHLALGFIEANRCIHFGKKL